MDQEAAKDCGIAEAPLLKKIDWIGSFSFCLELGSWKHFEAASVGQSNAPIGSFAKCLCLASDLTCARRVVAQPHDSAWSKHRLRAPQKN
jgi:hypothetical protein